jgi:hypothetical protein
MAQLFFINLLISHFTEHFHRQSRLEQITFHDTKIEHFTQTNIDHSRLTKIPFPTLCSDVSWYNREDDSVIKLDTSHVVRVTPKIKLLNSLLEAHCVRCESNTSQPLMLYIYRVRACPPKNYRVYKKNWTDLKLLSISQNSYWYPVFYIYGLFGYL